MLSKKIVVLCIVIMMVLSLAAGCSNGTGNPNNNPNDADSPNSKPQDQDTQKTELNYPKKPIEILVPWNAGGSSDTMARLLGELAPKYLDTTFNVVNRGGASGTVGTTEFLAKKADGYSLLSSAVAVFAAQPYLRDTKYQFDNFKPVVGLTDELVFMFTSKKTGFKSIEDLKNSGKSIKFGFSGPGSVTHLSQKALLDQAGINNQAVPFDGTGPAVTAVLGNHIDIAAAHPMDIIAYVKSGDIVLLGLFSNERSSNENFKDVPTFKELGYDIQFSVWKFIMAPKDTPDEIIAYLYEGFSNMMKDQKMLDFCGKSGTKIDVLSPQQLAEKMNKDIETYGELLQKVGLRKK